MSSTALEGFPFQEAGKDKLVRIIKKFSKLYFTEGNFLMWDLV